MAGLGLSGLASGVDTSSDRRAAHGDRARRARPGCSCASSLSAQQTTLEGPQDQARRAQGGRGDLRSAATWGETQTVESSDAARVAVARTGGAPIGGYARQGDAARRLGAEDLRLDASASADAAHLRRRRRRHGPSRSTSPPTRRSPTSRRRSTAAATCPSTPPSWAATSSSSPRARPAPRSSSAPTGGAARRDPPTRSPAATPSTSSTATPRRASATNVLEDAIPGVS